MTVACAAIIVGTVVYQGTDLYGTLFGRDSLTWARTLFWTGFGSLLVGAYLIHRFRKAKSRWPRH